MSLSRPVLLFLSFLVALCSLTYELILAQILAATLGGTLLRYSTVIGLFTLSLGGGALFFGRRFKGKSNFPAALFRVELILSFLGLASPLLLVFLEPFRAASGLPLLFEALFYLPVILIGWFSGYELPLLLALTRDRRTELQILALDYLGMFAGSLLVPLVLYPQFGPFLASLWMGILNLIGAAFIYFRSPSVRRSFLATAAFAGLAVTAFSLVGSQNLWLPWIREWYISSLSF